MKVAVWFAKTVWLAGCVVKAGAVPLTVLAQVVDAASK